MDSFLFDFLGQDLQDLLDLKNKIASIPLIKRFWIWFSSTLNAEPGTVQPASRQTAQD
jgi:hypothetical protein